MDDKQRIAIVETRNHASQPSRASATNSATTSARPASSSTKTAD